MKKIDKKVKDLINKAVINIIENTTSEIKLTDIESKHDKKIHFIPKRYRIFGGLLQSMNIQFGNFIEVLMRLIVESDGKYEIIKEYSGKNSNSFELSESNSSMIDKYIDDCQLSKTNINKDFNILLKNIFLDNDNNLNRFKNDIDLLFKDKKTNKIYYLEIKYNDDHDTGKFIDINRKFIKTYAYLSRELKINKYDDLIPIIFYFTNKRMKGNIYVPEETNILRGKSFFEKFLKTKYEDVDNYMNTLSESEENIKQFDELYNKVIK